MTKIDKIIDWELFRPTLEQTRKKERKPNVGAEGFDVIMLFKILILQSLYNLSNEAMEYQIIDRYSFFRFLVLYADSKVPYSIKLDGTWGKLGFFLHRAGYRHLFF